jgi:hypothetical protein
MDIPEEVKQSYLARRLFYRMYATGAACIESAVQTQAQCTQYGGYGSKPTESMGELFHE